MTFPSGRTLRLVQLKTTKGRRNVEQRVRQTLISSHCQHTYSANSPSVRGGTGQRIQSLQTLAHPLSRQPSRYHRAPATRHAWWSLSFGSPIFKVNSSLTLIPSNPHSCTRSYANSVAMPSISQPQTPAAVDFPLRERRQRSVERVTDRLETPSLDDRSYRVIRLPNQLEVLLVHDGETDKASAAMDVNVGNFSDATEFPGEAHAVEHLLFMGTKKVEL